MTRERVMTMRRWIMVLALLFLAGCKTVPTADTMPPAAPQPVVEAPDSIGEAIGEANDVDSVIDPATEQELDNLDEVLGRI